MPKIAIVGRVNVGKSTLFNRLTETQQAMTSPIAGTTRDRTYAPCLWRGLVLTITDTGGLLERTEDSLQEQIQTQVHIALNEADAVLFVLDGIVGLTEEDRRIATALRTLKKPVLVVVNKIDGSADRVHPADAPWHHLGFKKGFLVSAINGSGTGDLLDGVMKELKLKPDTEIPPTPDPVCRVAILGKPNVGKSSLLNALVGEERMIVSPLPFTTREPNDTLYTFEQRPILLIDTAGIRKKSHVGPGLEKTGVSKTLGVLARTDIAVLVLDPYDQGIGHQDLTLGELIEERGVSALIVVNKSDLVALEDLTTLKQKLPALFPHLKFAPMVFASTKTKDHIKGLLPLILQIRATRKKVIPQEELDNFLIEAQYIHEKTIYTKFRRKDKKRIRLTDMQQLRYDPPVFQIKKNTKEPLPQGFEGFIYNRFRERFPFLGTPVEFRIIIKEKE